MLKTKVVSILVATLVMVVALGWGLALAESPEKVPPKAGDPGIQNGSTVKMEYTLSDGKGKILDTNKGQEPLTYTHGEGQIISGLEKALTGLRVGDQKHVVVPPQEGYGPIKPEAIIEVPKERIPRESQKVGTQLMARNQNGPPIPFLVKEVKEKTIVLDANHPLAGMTLTFDVKIVGVEPAQTK
jgi:FKBP-type peptidyl-prolyl cis-trans isomerase 2